MQRKQNAPSVPPYLCGRTKPRSQQAAAWISTAALSLSTVCAGWNKPRCSLVQMSSGMRRVAKEEGNTFKGEKETLYLASDFLASYHSSKLALIINSDSSPYLFFYGFLRNN